MGTLTRIWLVAALAAAAVVAALVVLAQGGGAPAARPFRALSVHATVGPIRSAFADRILVRVVVSADARVVDTSRLRIKENLDPFTPIGRMRTTRATRGPMLVVTREVPVACFIDACVPTKDRRPVSMRPVTVRAPRKAGGVVTARGLFPDVSVERRVTPGDVSAQPPPYRTDLTPPPFRFRVAPGSAALALEILAALLAAAAVVLVASVAAGIVRSRRAHELGELGRALAIVRGARARPPRDRRKALALLAQLLETRHEPLADSAEQLAWSRSAPSPEDLVELASTAEREVNGR